MNENETPTWPTALEVLLREAEEKRKALLADDSDAIVEEADRG